MTYFEEAARVLLANKVRSLLTIIGLVIGVGAVIAIQVLGNSMAGAVDGALGSLTDNSFVIFPNTRQRNIAKAAITLNDLAGNLGARSRELSPQYRSARRANSCARAIARLDSPCRRMPRSPLTTYRFSTGVI